MTANKVPTSAYPSEPSGDTLQPEGPARARSTAVQAVPSSAHPTVALDNTEPAGHQMARRAVEADPLNRKGAPR